MADSKSGAVESKPYFKYMGIERKSIIDDMFGRPGKKCAMCGRTLEHWQFNKSGVSSDGLQSYCKDCQRKYRSKHPDKQYKKNRKDNSLLLFNEEI